jgi:hypothetical protein
LQRGSIGPVCCCPLIIKTHTTLEKLVLSDSAKLAALFDLLRFALALSFRSVFWIEAAPGQQNNRC